MQNPAMRIQLIIWGAFLMSTLVYVALPFAMQPLDAPPPDLVLPVALAVTAACITVVSFLFPPFIHRSAIRNAAPEIVEEPDPAEVAFRDRVPMRRVFADPDAVRALAIRVSFTPRILGIALAESIAIFGFVLRILGHSFLTAAPFFVVCWVLMAARFPHVPSMVRFVEKTCDARLVARPPR